jgi:hypothetical protein
MLWALIPIIIYELTVALQSGAAHKIVPMNKSCVNIAHT